MSLPSTMIGMPPSMVLHVECQTVAPAFVAQRIVSDRFHRFDINGCNTALRILHDDVEHPLPIAHCLLGHTAQINRARTVPSLRRWLRPFATLPHGPGLFSH